MGAGSGAVEHQANRSASGLLHMPFITACTDKAACFPIWPVCTVRIPFGIAAHFGSRGISGESLATQTLNGGNHRGALRLG